jgi:hypothetical protein
MRSLATVVSLALVVLAAAVLWPRSSLPRISGAIAFTSYADPTDPVYGPLLGNVQGSIVVWRNGKATTILAPAPSESFDTPNWSPDGATIAVGHGIACWTCSPPEMVLIDATGNHEASFTAGTAEWLGPRRLSVGSAAVGDYELVLNGGAWVTRDVSVHRHGRGPSAVSPDGRWVAYGVGDELLVAPRTGGKGHLLARCPTRCGDPAWRPTPSR